MKCTIDKGADPLTYAISTDDGENLAALTGDDMKRLMAVAGLTQFVLPVIRERMPMLPVIGFKWAAGEPAPSFVLGA